MYSTIERGRRSKIRRRPQPEFVAVAPTRVRAADAARRGQCLQPAAGQGVPAPGVPPVAATAMASVVAGDGPPCACVPTRGSGGSSGGGRGGTVPTGGNVPAPPRPPFPPWTCPSEYKRPSSSGSSVQRSSRCPGSSETKGSAADEPSLLQAPEGRPEERCGVVVFLDHATGHCTPGNASRAKTALPPSFPPRPLSLSPLTAGESTPPSHGGGGGRGSGVVVAVTPTPPPARCRQQVHLHIVPRGHDAAAAAIRGRRLAHQPRRAVEVV